MSVFDKKTFPEAESYNLLGLKYTKNDLDILAKKFEGLEGLTKGLSPLRPQAVYMADRYPNRKNPGCLAQLWL